jgi:hypothetical protein
MNATLVYGMKPSHSDQALFMIANAIGQLEDQ